jgi:hypothetical protein
MQAQSPENLCLSGRAVVCQMSSRLRTAGCARWGELGFKKLGTWYPQARRLLAEEQ